MSHYQKIWLTAFSEYFNALSPEQQEQFIIDLFSKTSYPLLKRHFQRNRFYGWITYRPQRRVNKTDVQSFLLRQDGRPRRKNFILAIDYTPAAIALAKEKGVLLLNYTQIARPINQSRQRNRSDIQILH